MKRIFGILALSLAALLLLAACAPQEKPVSFDIEALGQELIAKAPFDDELVRLNDLAARATWQIKDAAIIAYAGSGATSEEIVIVDAADAAAAKDALTLLTNYRNTRRELFAGYNVSQVPRLESAVLMTADHYAIYCVSADAAAAQQVIDTFLAAQGK